MDLKPFETYLSINVGKKTTNNYVNQMKGFFLHFQEFNQESINNYLASKVNVWSSGSMNAFFKAVKWYMKFTKIMVELPKTKKVERKPRSYLPEKDFDEMISKMPIMFKDGQKVSIVIEVMFQSGIRPKEMLNLKREHINLKEGILTIVDTKTHQSRFSFITKDLANNISNYFNNEAEKENAFNLNQQSLSYYCRTISKYMNIKLNPYKIRHSSSHNFLKRNGNNLVALANILGHRSIETTRIYSDIDTHELHEIFNKAFKNKKKGKK